MIAVQGVSAAAEIIVIPLCRKHVINLVVKPLEAEHTALLISLCRVVEHDVKNDFNSVVVKLPDEGFQLFSFFIVLICSCVAGVGRKKSHGIVAPVVQKLLPPASLAFIISSNSKMGMSSTALIPSSLEIGDFFHEAAKVPLFFTPEDAWRVNPRT